MCFGINRWHRIYISDRSFTFTEVRFSDLIAMEAEVKTQLAHGHLVAEWVNGIGLVWRGA